MRIDLHTHSSVSDGTETPAELLATAHAAGLDVVALTDHDTTEGWAEAEANRPAGLTVVPGMELSCRWFPDGPAADQRPPAGLPVRPRAPRRCPPSARGCAPSGCTAASGSCRTWSPTATRSSGTTSSPAAAAGSSAGRTSRGHWSPPGSWPRSTRRSRRCSTTAASTTWPRPTPRCSTASAWSARPAGAGLRARAGPPPRPGAGRRRRGRHGRAPGCSGSRSTTPTTTPEERAHMAGLADDARACSDRVQRLPRHQQDDADRRVHDRARAARGAARAGTGSPVYRD